MSVPVLSLAAIRQPAFLYDAAARIVEANDLAEALAGRPLSGTPAPEFTRIFGHRHPDGRMLEMAELPVCRALGGGEVVNLPLTVTTADGSTLHILATASPLREDGTVTGALVIWHDVTPGERLREALAESEEKYRNLVELAPDAILINQDGRIVFANQAAAALHGVSRPEELVGRGALEFVHPRNRESVDRVIAADLQGEECPIPMIELVRADGTTVPVQGRGARIPFGGRPAVQVVLRDLTADQRAAAALQASEERLRLAQESANIAVWDWIAGTGKVTYTPDFLRPYGVRAEFISTYEAWRRLVHPEDIVRVEAERDEAIARGEPFDVEFRVITPAGQVRWLQGFGRGIRDEHGRLVRIIGVNLDITGRKEAEEALRESGAMYRRFVDDDITGMFISVPDGRLLDCNPAFARMFGFASVEEARSSTVIETYVVPGERDALLARLRRERRLENEERFRRRRDGTAIHVVENLIGDFDPAGELVQIRGYIRDDTQRYLAEAALRERERVLQGIFRAAPVGIGMVSHRIIVEANEQLCRMTGYSRDDLIGQNARLLYPSEEAYEFVGREKYAQILADGVGAVETQWQRKDGAVRDVLVSSSPIDLTRPYEDVVFNALDITRLRESERAIERYMDELRVSNEELQRFAYVASHDLQEPLRSIVSFSQLLERRYKGRLDSDADEFIGFIIDGGMRMQRLIEDLLQLSRVETKAKPPVPTESEAVVYDVLRLMEAAIADAGATVTVGPLPRVMADEAQLAQVFQNLISNALKYRRPDLPPEVRISAERDGQFWRFAVADNGIGIEEEYFDRIFVIFQRLHTREEYAGTGIGLAVVKRIVERHGGRIRVESTPGVGSTFFFTLPAA